MSDDDDDIELLPIIQLQLWSLYHTYSSYKNKCYKNDLITATSTVSQSTKQEQQT